MSKSKTTKRALLFSIVSFAVCVAMLVGTTFAWFTDSASANGNKIQAGTLDVQLVDAGGNNLEGTTLGWVAADGRAQTSILWEPGASYNLQDVYVKNNGNLALKYKIVVTGLTGSAKLLEAIDFTVNGTVPGTEYSLGAGATSGAISITGKMKETAGNEYQGLSIEGVSITVVATQDTVEVGKTDNQYDAAAEFPVVVTNATELAAAITSNKTAVLAADMAIDIDVDSTGKPQTFATIAKTTSSILDLNGYDLNFVTENVTANNSYAALDVKGNLKIQGTGTISLTHKGTDMGWSASSSVLSVGGSVEIGDGATIQHLGGTSMAYAIDVLGWGSDTAKVNITGGTVTSTYRPIRIFANHAQNFILNISGGDIHSTSTATAIWIQYFDSGANVTVNVTGGNISSTKWNAIYVDATYSATYSNANDKVLINVTGGTLTNSYTELTEGHAVIQNERVASAIDKITVNYNAANLVSTNGGYKYVAATYDYTAGTDTYDIAVK